MEDLGIDGGASIRMDIREVEWEQDWIDLVQDRDRWRGQ